MGRMSLVNAVEHHIYFINGKTNTSTFAAGHADRVCPLEVVRMECASLVGGLKAGYLAVCFGVEILHENLRICSHAKPEFVVGAGAYSISSTQVRIFGGKLDFADVKCAFA